MSRPRQPLALAKLKGAKRSRLNEHEPRFRGVPKCPAWLPKDAKAEWRRAYALLEPYDILKATDQAVFAAYCVSFARWKQAEEMVEAEGQTVREPVVSRSGYDTGKYKIKVHPAVGIAKAERSLMQRLAALIGLDPSSRTRIAVGDPDDLSVEDDDDDDFMNVSIN